MNLHRRVLGPSPPGNSNNANDSYTNTDTSFDTTMVIVLASLLCALIFALGLNSIVRCALRCRRRLSMDTADSHGLKKRALRQIPVAVYGSEMEISATECPICLGEFVEGERVRVLPKCNHGFHVNCIDRWLLSHSSCPNCRHSLIERPTDSRVQGETASARPPV